MATDDVQVLVTGQADAPATFTIPGNGQLQPKAIFASYDGTSAGGDFLPAIKIISDGGETVGVYPTATTVVAGASADVSWFPRLASSASISPTGFPFYTAYSPVVAVQTIPLVGMSITAKCWTQNQLEGFFATYADIYFGSDHGSTNHAYQIKPLAPNVGPFGVDSALGFIGVGYYSLAATGTFPCWIDGQGFLWTYFSDYTVGYMTPTNIGTITDGDILFSGTWQGPLIHI